MTLIQMGNHDKLLQRRLQPRPALPSASNQQFPEQAIPITFLMQIQPSTQTLTSNGKQARRPRKPGWRVVLGRAAWSRHTHERPEGDELKLLGSVSKGAQVGALAMTVQGEYVQVVGDHLTPLKTKEVAKAVANAPKEPYPEFSSQSPAWPVARKEAPAPVVIVKKRRVAVMP